MMIVPLQHLSISFKVQCPVDGNVYTPQVTMANASPTHHHPHHKARRLDVMLCASSNQYTVLLATLDYQLILII